MSGKRATHEHATELTQRCPACRDDAHAHRQVYTYALRYLCDEHREVWLSADRSMHQRSRGCPHAPSACTTGVCA